MDIVKGPIPFDSYTPITLVEPLPGPYNFTRIIDRNPIPATLTANPISPATKKMWRVSLQNTDTFWSCLSQLILTRLKCKKRGYRFNLIFILWNHMCRINWTAVIIHWRNNEYQGFWDSRKLHQRYIQGPSVHECQRIYPRECRSMKLPITKQRDILCNKITKILRHKHHRPSPFFGGFTIIKPKLGLIILNFCVTPDRFHRGRTGKTRGRLAYWTKPGCSGNTHQGFDFFLSFRIIHPDRQMTCRAPRKQDIRLLNVY